MKTLDNALKGTLRQECKRKDFDEYTRLECEFEKRLGAKRRVERGRERVREEGERMVEERVHWIHKREV